MSKGDTTSGHRYQRPGSEWPHDGRAAFGSVAAGFVRKRGDNMDALSWTAEGGRAFISNLRSRGRQETKRQVIQIQTGSSWAPTCALRRRVERAWRTLQASPRSNRGVWRNVLTQTR